MKPVRKHKRPKRRIKIAGKWTGGEIQAQDDQGTKPSVPQGRPVYLTDGSMNVHAAALATGLGVQTLYNRRNTGKPPASYKVGGRVFYHPEEIDAFLNGE